MLASRDSYSETDFNYTYKGYTTQSYKHETTQEHEIISFLCSRMGMAGAVYQNIATYEYMSGLP